MAAEVASLEWLRIVGGPPLPVVLQASDARLVTAGIPAGDASPEAAVQLGRQLAIMHASGAPAFGAGPPGSPEQAWFGTTRMTNRIVPNRDWATWYAEDRLVPYVELAVRQGSISSQEAAVFDEVRERLPQLGGPPEPVARLHGDLWSGNVVWSTDGAWLIDPAAHGGHREADLALLTLFGCPYLDRIRSSYAEVSPLADGWKHRVALHQLFPLLAHVVMFGRSYAADAIAAARAALS